MKDLHLTDLIDIKVLQQFQDGFSRYVGVAALTSDAEGIPVTRGSGFTYFCRELVRKSKLGCKRCEECDRNGAVQTMKEGKISVYRCHAGLVDFAAPIMVEGKFLGTVAGGQVRVEDIDEDEMRQKAIELSIDPQEYVDAAKETRVLSMEEVEKAGAFWAEIAKIVSEMAYRNYQAFDRNKKLENTARTQAAMVSNLSINMQKNMLDWTEHFKKAVHSSDQKQMEDAVREFIYKGTEMCASLDDAAQIIKMTDGDGELSEGEYSLRDVLQHTVDEVAAKCPKTEVDFRLEVEDSVPKCLLGDFDRISQVVNHLLLNSINFTEEGNITVHVSNYKASYACRIVIEIRDTGRGMTTEQLTYVRDYIGNSNLNLLRDKEGADLGMSIIILLIRQMSGTIEVDSQLGAGSVFKITVPQLEVKGGEG